jgi:enoyl-[acyl-carrier-protein] reductase (NADH)
LSPEPWAVWLASDAISGVTGSAIVIDGGFMAGATRG